MKKLTNELMVTKWQKQADIERLKKYRKVKK
jgi:hypothetical protein